ncbi:MAG TPA: tol-pal system-associated acyl-CoA thioesterase [Xanthomonadaceae bacterium]|nr:tol-pal system-associated acyl-CoA thioesterase [Xanthomonadaceae bacterium]
MPDIYAAFTWPTRVYWEDTDAGGVVYHAAYLCFLERARTEWLRWLGLEQQRLREEHDLVFAVRGLRMDFHLPARLDDLLEVRVRLLELRAASLRFAQSIERNGATLVSAEVRAACLSASAFRPRTIPADLFPAPESDQ